MFEKFKSPSFYLASQSVLSLYSSGRTTGIVLESGHSITHSIAVHEGRVISGSIKCLDVAGRDLTNSLGKMFEDSGISITDTNKLEIFRDMKEKLCYIADTFDLEIQKSCCDFEKYYELPDGLSRGWK
eukprot:Pompholyxophrys_punicea_v1_NODE_835_length_1230_cov_3.129362.p2 type:complete len:128 gc:universal NODE_835_length_1230_cov_3.129362:327-710(+)